MIQEGRVLSLYISPRKGEPMVEVQEVEAIADVGLKGPEFYDRYALEVRQGSYSGTKRIPDLDRQETFMAEEAYLAGIKDTTVPLGKEETRRNIYTRGIDWENTRGATVTIISPEGVKSRHEVVEEAEPCDLPDKKKKGFKPAFTSNWRGGVRARIIISGPIKPNSVVYVDDGKETFVFEDPTLMKGEIDLPEIERPLIETGNAEIDF